MAKLKKVLKGQSVTEQIDLINENVESVNTDLEKVVNNENGYITADDIPVKKVNGKTGDVSLSASDVGAFPNHPLIQELDINNLKETGVYVGYYGDNTYYLIVIKHNSGYIYQELIGVETKQYRRFTGGQWQKWEKIYSTENPVKAGDVKGINVVDTDTELTLALLENGTFVKADIKYNPSTKKLYIGDNEFVTKEYIDNMSSAIKSIIVTTLPETGVENTIYFVPNSNTESKNSFNEYLYVDGKWEIIGGTTIDLTPFLKTEDAEKTYAKISSLDDKVSKTTTINGKTLYNNITLTAEDVGALPSDTKLSGDVVYRNTNAEIVVKLGNGEFVENDVVLATDNGAYKQGHIYRYNNGNLDDITDIVTDYVALTGDQSIAGTKNFTGLLRYGGVNVATTDDIKDVEDKLPTIDSALSTTSTNPVQNKVITTEINKKANQSALDDLSGKVDLKVSKSYVDEKLDSKANVSDLTNYKVLKGTQDNPIIIGDLPVGFYILSRTSYARFLSNESSYVLTKDVAINVMTNNSDYTYFNSTMIASNGQINDGGVYSLFTIDKNSGIAGGVPVENGTSLNGSVNYSTGSISFYAPTSAGKAGQLLQSNGANKSPQWINNNFVAKDVSDLTNYKNNTQLTSLLNEKQDNLTDTQLQAVNSGANSTNIGQISTNTQAITTINNKIPAQASSTNQLADKEFVNSTVSTATATFRGTYNTLAELQAVTADENDYGFVKSTDSTGNTVYKRYKYSNKTWMFEYDLNNSSFTAEQWASINSGITATEVEKINNLSAEDISCVDNSGKDLGFTNTQEAIDFMTGGMFQIAEMLEPLPEQVEQNRKNVETLGNEASKEIKNIKDTLKAKVDNTTTINGKALSGNITLEASDVGALPNTTTIPTVNDGTLTIKKNGETIATFSANQNYNVIADVGGTNDATSSALYDLVIRDQDDFSDWIRKLNSNNFAGRSVAIVNSGTSYSAQYVRLMGNISRIDGIGNPVIDITDLMYVEGALESAIYYPEVASIIGAGCSISGITVNIRGLMSGVTKVVGFKNFTRVENCHFMDTLAMEGVDTSSNTDIGFEGCNNLYNTSVVALAGTMKPYVDCSSIVGASAGVMSMATGTSTIFTNCNGITDVLDFSKEIDPSIENTLYDSDCRNIWATKEEIPDTSNFVTKSVSDLTNYKNNTQLTSLLNEKQDKITSSSKLSNTLVSGLGTASTVNTGTSSGNVPVLGSNGKLPSSVIPASAITNTFVSSSESGMLGFSTADVGDVCVRTDLKKTFILKATPYSTLSNWQELLTPTDAVTTVNGQTGHVILTAEDIGALPSNTEIPKINSGTLYFEKNGGIIGSFTNNQDYDSYFDISMPRDTLYYGEMDLDDDQKAQARLNIGAGTSNFSGYFQDLQRLPSLVNSIDGVTGHITGIAKTSDLGTQVTYSLSGTTLTITPK